MNDRREIQSPSRLAGYSSWFRQMPGRDGSVDLLVCVPLGVDAHRPGRSRNRLLVALGEVSGRGEGASRSRSLITAAIRRLLDETTDPASLLKTLNDDPPIQDHSQRFATLVVAVIDGDRHELTLANAGHVAPIVRHADRRTEPLATDLIGFPLWVLAGHTYEEATVPVGPGDLLVFYSDDVTSVVDEQNGLFGHERLRESIARAPDEAGAVGRSILQAIEDFRGGRASMDAITLLCIARDGPNQARISKE